MNNMIMGGMNNMIMELTCTRGFTSKAWRPTCRWPAPQKAVIYG